MTDGYTMLLLHADGTNASTTVIDSSPSAKTVTAVGNAQISTAQSKFGGSSILLDGTGDYLSVADSNDWYFTGDFTLELWARFSAMPSSNAALICQYGNTTAEASWNFYVAGGKLKFIGYNGLTFPILETAAYTWTLNQWYHLAVERVSNTMNFYINGTQVYSGSWTDILVNTAYPLRIGRYNDATPAMDLNGYVDEVRVSKGIARYQGAFTPQTAAFRRRPVVASLS